MWFLTMTYSIQWYVIFMCMKLLLQETEIQMKKERLAHKLVDYDQQTMVKEALTKLDGISWREMLLNIFVAI